MHRLMRTLLDLPHPTAAIVEGRCLGGGFELALCCDDILAADPAIFGLPEIRSRGLPAGGRRAAADPGRRLAGDRAVITGDYADAPATGTTPAWSRWSPPRRRRSTRHATGSSGSWRRIRPSALGHAALAARAVWRPAVDRAIAENERRYLNALLASPDAEEGVRAWLEKRAPGWTHQ